MAQGVPVVALAELGTRDLLAAGRGALVPREDAADFAAACARLLADRALRDRLGAEARALAAAWSARAMAERLARLWSDLSERAAARRRRAR
jgi:1,2-diacylglycerol 3-alpha-glucosyltransferase